jgi:hypothetical protein
MVKPTQIIALLVLALIISGCAQKTNTQKTNIELPSFEHTPTDTQTTKTNEETSESHSSTNQKDLSDCPPGFKQYPNVTAINSLEGGLYDRTIYELVGYTGYSAYCRKGGVYAGEKTTAQYCYFTTSCERLTEKDVVLGFFKMKVKAEYEIIDSTEWTENEELYNISFTFNYKNFTLSLQNCKSQIIKKSSLSECQSAVFSKI